MSDYKEMTTLIPAWAEWCSVDANGRIDVSAKKPKGSNGIWAHGADYIQIGKGPPPKDWAQELYELVPDE